jgi:hypothetical protein
VEINKDPQEHFFQEIRRNFLKSYSPNSVTSSSDLVLQNHASLSSESSPPWTLSTNLPFRLPSFPSPPPPKPITKMIAPDRFILFLLTFLALAPLVASAPDCGASGSCGDCTDTLLAVYDPDTCHTDNNHNMCTGRTKDVCDASCPNGYGIFKGTGGCGFLWTGDKKRCAQCSKGYSAEEGCGEATCKVWGIEVWSTCEAQGGCIPCAVGKYAANDGSTTCAECPAGKQSYFDTTKSSSQMIDITKEAGRLAPIKVGAATNCYTCPMGKRGEQPGELLCDTCKGNTYTDKVGQTECPYCPPGKQAENWSYELVTEGSNIDDFYKSCDSEDCQEPDGTASTKCNDCPRGRFSTNLDDEDQHSR